jgi:N-acetylmuramate 1-kinase
MNEEIRKFLDNNLGTVKYEFMPIKKGGSDRSFFRVKLPEGKSFIFMYYGTDVEENAFWADINRFLAGLDIAVPQIIAEDDMQHFLVLEDLGDIDLWSQKTLPWDKRSSYYHQALIQIRRLHAFDLSRLPLGLNLSESYGEKLYCWEHDYFLDNLVREVCMLKLSSAFSKDLREELKALVIRLLKIEPSLIHRDFQSQNIMIKNGRPMLIDFQGMRPGNLFYDLGSLICDPYVTFAVNERGELIAFYYELMRPPYSLQEFTDHFWEASAQRLMQALGAYGFLGLRKNKPDFLKHIHSGIDNLLTAATEASTLPVLRELADKCIPKAAKKQI